MALDTDAAEMMGNMRTLKHVKLADTDVTVHTDRQATIKRLSEIRLKGNTEIEIWRLIGSRWNRGYKIMVEWTRRDPRGAR